MLMLLSLLACFPVGTLSEYSISQVHTAFYSTNTSLTVHWAVKSFPSTNLLLGYKASSNSNDYSYSKAFCESFYNKVNDPSTRKLTTCKSLITDLIPNTFYDYKIGSDVLGWSTQYTLRSPRATIDSRFIVYADFGIGAQTLDTIVSLKTKMNTDTYDGILHIGDMAYNLNSQDGTYGDLFLEAIEPIASQFPYMVAQGNHETSGSLVHYQERFTMPGNSKNLWYSFNHGKVHFLVYTQEPLFSKDDNADDLLEEQLEFIHDDLEELDRTAYPWLIVCTHRPFYCSENNHTGSQPYYSEDPSQKKAKHINNFVDCTTAASKIRDNFEDLWYNYKVDLVLTGHVHNYERMHATYNSQYQGCNVTSQNYCQGAKAPIYIISGVPGNQESYAYGSNARPDYSAFQTSHLSFGVLEIFNETDLHWEQLASDTHITLDYLNLSK